MLGLWRSLTILVVGKETQLLLDKDRALHLGVVEKTCLNLLIEEVKGMHHLNRSRKTINVF